MKTKIVSGFLAIVALSASGSAFALTCVDDSNSFTVDPALACVANPQTNPDNDSWSDGDPYPDTLTFQPGGLTADWIGIDKDPDQATSFENALTLTGSGLGGGFTVNTAGLNFANYALYIKGGSDGVFFLLDMSQAVGGVLTGTWSIAAAPGITEPANGMSHISLYGSGTREVPEPASLALLGLGLLGIGAARRRRA